MTIVKIVNGTYGHTPAGSKYVIPVTPRDLPISVEDDEAKRLVSMGVAMYVDAEMAVPAVATALSPSDDGSTISNSPSDEGGESGDSDPAEDAAPDAETLKGMKLEELRAMANELGIADADSFRKKSELIDAICEATPSLSAEDVVE